jgi:hypothetical protein
MISFFKYVIFFLSTISLFVCTQSHAQSINTPNQEAEKSISVTLRVGQGGFSDDRSDINKLGGGQMAIDIKHADFPIALSYSGEYYTNSANPKHSYEIAELYAINALVMHQIKRVTLFAGGGLGGLDVPSDNAPGKMHKGTHVNFEAGVNVLAFWKIGFYGIYKYLYAQKKVKAVKVINFNEHIVLIGITLNLNICGG